VEKGSAGRAKRRNKIISAEVLIKAITMKAIGIGCFWFADPDGEPENYTNFSPAQHIEKIRRALESIDNITSLEIARRGDSYYVHGESFSGDEEEENYFPLIGRISIQFDIFMPDRVQQKHDLGRGHDNGVENFHVRIVYGGGLPVTYIHYDVQGGEAECITYSPSSTIIFVREFLEEKLSDQGEIEFQYLGPSPFHADFFVASCSDHSADSTAIDVSSSGLGYRTFYFEFPVSDDKLIDTFIASHQSTLSAYYSVIRYRNRSLRLGNKIAGGTQLLISSSMSGGLTSIRRWFRHGPIIDDVYKSILDQKMNNIELTNFFSSRKADEEMMSPA
jgi:hypothetical protein